MKPGRMPYAAKHGNMPMLVGEQLAQLPSGFQRLKFTASGCWLWTGSAQSKGYGSLKIGGRNWLAHRFIYTQLVGPIAPTRTIDHVCNTKLCMNVGHMENVTRSVNTRRRWQRERQLANS